MKSRGPVSSTHEVLRLLLLEQASGCPERHVVLHTMSNITKMTTSLHETEILRVIVCIQRTMHETPTSHPALHYHTAHAVSEISN